MQTLLLDNVLWDLVLDINNSIAVASNPYSLAQDAASAIRTFLGEVYTDTTIGVPWLQQILGKSPTLSALKSVLNAAAMTVPDVTASECFITAFNGRVISGQVQVTSATTGQTSEASFTVVNPQGVG